MENQNKAIVINNFLKFQNIEIPKELNPFIKPKYYVGNWNVFRYTEELEKFLTENDIAFQFESKK